MRRLVYLHDDAALFEEVLLGAATEFSMSEEFVAKDYWAVAMLANPGIFTTCTSYSA